MRVTKRVSVSGFVPGTVILKPRPRGSSWMPHFSSW